MGLENYKPIIVMVGCQFLYAGVTLSGRAALLQDFSSRVFVVYRQFTAFLLIAPFAFFSRRGTNSCAMNWKSFFLISLLSLIGVTINQNVYFEGLYLASSSAASALCNLVPAITFTIAYFLGLEKIDLGNVRSLGKIMGTCLCVSGAVIMAVLKGSKLLNMELLPRNSIVLHLVGEEDRWLIGCLFLLASTTCWSIWLILQVHVTSYYPDHLSLTAWMCLIAAVQSAILTFIIEPDLNTWKLTSSLQLFSCFYAGVVSALTFFGQAWCIGRRGPLFSAMFNPLCTVIVTIFACIFMHEELYMGSLTGGLAVIIGLYVVLWGKAKDHEQIKEEDTKKQNNVNGQNEAIHSDDLEQPLLCDH
ncbi:WAT1-related protein At4g30420-like [Salvia hispanica]|uniref:WAT1-related protein At4g30420-like n=1 Tax=Salvia hispanica TaxID=49212 RepID=UPI002008FFF3|nr:WAT1-related protein At4g30420-like [Salvia hispanica]